MGPGSGAGVTVEERWVASSLKRALVARCEVVGCPGLPEPDRFGVVIL